MRHSKTAMAATIALAFAATPALAQEEVTSAGNNEWISVTGTVKSVRPEGFSLSYGDGDIRVEMDDYDTYSETFVAPGDRVTVSGRIDDDFYEMRKIEASSVYIDGLNEFFYASSADEEDGYYAYPVTEYDYDDEELDDEWVAMSGTVSNIGEEKLTLDTGSTKIEVDTSGLEDDPLDDEGATIVDIGDRISVTGELDDADLFEDREMLASSIVVLTGSGA